MSEKQNKRFKKAIDGLAPIQYNKTIKAFKKIKTVAWLCHNIPNKAAIVSKKRHSGESLADFRVRRKACNHRRRDRDSHRQLNLMSADVTKAGLVYGTAMINRDC